MNNANEEQKFGFSRDEIIEDFEQIQKLSNLEINGIMNMAPLNATENEIQVLFEDVINIKKEIEQKYNCRLNEISMGMSQDYKIAAKVGSTMLRLGRILFEQ